MKIALIGYGKMGKEIERIARSRGHETERLRVSNMIVNGVLTQHNQVQSNCLKYQSCLIAS